MRVTILVYLVVFTSKIDLNIVGFVVVVYIYKSTLRLAAVPSVLISELSLRNWGILMAIADDPEHGSWNGHRSSYI